MIEPGVSADPKVTLAVAAGMKEVATMAIPAMPVIANSDLNMDPLVFDGDDMRGGVIDERCEEGDLSLWYKSVCGSSNSYKV
jgi:hypothetical protein